MDHPQKLPPRTIQMSFKISEETRGKLNMLIDEISVSLGIKISLTQAMEVIINEAFEKRRNERSAQ